MPQKPGKFQSKSQGQKRNFSGGKGRSEERGARPPRGEKGGFSKSFKGDRGGPGRRDGEGRARPFGDKPFRDKPAGDRPFRDRPSGDRPVRDRPFKERSFGDRPARGDKPYREGSARKSFGDKPFGDRPKGRGKPFGEKSFGGKKFEGRTFGDRKFENRDFDGARPEGRRSEGKRFEGKRFEGKKFEGKRDGDRQDRPFRGASSQGRSFDRDRSFGERKGPRRESRGFEDKRSAPRYERRERDYDQTQDHGGREQAREKLKSSRANYGAPSPAYLYGIHPVTQALLNPERRHNRLLVTEGGQDSLRATIRKAEQEGIELPEITLVETTDIERLLPRDAVHQDILLDTQPLEDVFLADIILHAKDDTCVLVLDQVTDPHNVGAIMRSAAAFGASAVIVQKLHAPEITGTLAKSASGAVEHVPLIREVNLARALTQLKEAGFTCLGFDERGDTTLAGAKPSGKIAVVLGAEGDGLRRLVAESCDFLVRLPTQGEIASLNVSNAAAVALYELARGRK